jgi:hypothetical protein
MNEVFERFSPDEKDIAMTIETPSGRKLQIKKPKSLYEKVPYVKAARAIKTFMEAEPHGK